MHADLYLRSANLLRVAADWEMARAAFISVYNSQSTAVLNNCREISFEPLSEDWAAAALEIFEDAHECEASPFGAMLHLFRQPESDLARRMTASVGRSGDSGISYTFDACILEDLFRLLPAQRTRLPAGFDTSIGDCEDIQGLLRALLALSGYHAIANVHGAGKLEVQGMGLESAALQRRPERLATVLARASGVSEEVARRLVALLTYGSLTTTPDPVLQPLLPFEGGTILLSPMLLLDSDLERNYLALLARAMPAEFDSLSHLFEQQMLSRITMALDGRDWLYRKNLLASCIADAGEIDLLICDRESRCLVVLELRWMLRPGEASEVCARRRDLPHKAAQARRKLECVRARASEVLALFGIADDPSGWAIEGGVVLDGFFETPEGGLDLLWLTRSLAVRQFRQCSRLRDFVVGVRSRKMFPREGVDFSVDETKREIGPFSLVCKQLSFLESDEGFLPRGTVLSL